MIKFYELINLLNFKNINIHKFEFGNKYWFYCNNYMVNFYKLNDLAVCINIRHIKYKNEYNRDRHKVKFISDLSVLTQYID